MTDQIRFEVGEKYENMKGVFEVIAIRRDSMDIRWEDGEEISTPIDLQQRIIERMQHEKEMAEAQALQKLKKAKAAASKSGKQFAGLEDSDFSNSVSKTVWRGRGQLGGAVTQHLKSTQFKFNSWAVLRKPEVHWLDVKRQKHEDLSSQVKFHARVEAEALFYGIHVPAPDAAATHETDWHAAVKWLGKPENDAWLKKQSLAHELGIRDLDQKGFRGELTLQDDVWVHTGSAGKDAPVESLSTFLSTALESGAVNLRIEKRIAKDAAVEKKKGIASDIAALFEMLMPMYAAAVEG